MKQIIKFSFFLVAIITFFNHGPSAFAEEAQMGENITTTTEPLSYSNEAADQLLYVDDEHYIIVTKDSEPSIEFINNGISRLKIIGVIGNWQMEGDVFKMIYEFDGYHYLEVSLNTWQTKSITFANNQIINCFLLHNGYLIFGGDLDGDANLLFYQLALTYIDTKIYANPGYQTITHLVSNNNQLLVGGLKDANAVANIYFKNAGNLNERKSFLWLLDAQNEPISSQYLNEQTDFEIVTQLVFKNGCFDMLLQTPSEIYRYIFTTNLTLLQVQVFKPSEVVVDIISSPSSWTLILQDGHELYWQDFAEASRHYVGDGQYLHGDIVNGELQIIHTSAVKWHKTIINHYHLAAIKPIVIDHLMKEIDFNDYIAISSYFAIFQPAVVSSEPTFNRLIYGNYQIEHTINLDNGKNITLKNTAQVMPYCNVYDDGIYNTNHLLLFRGDGYLNGERIFNGHVLNVPGNFTLQLIGANGQSQWLNFVAINGYYREIEAENCKIDKQIFPEQSTFLEVNFPSEYQINNVIINDNNYLNWEHSDNKLRITFEGSEPYQLDCYHIQAIEYQRAGQVSYLTLDQRYFIQTLASSPELTLTTKSTLGMEISLEIHDAHQTLRDFYFLVNGEKTITGLKNHAIELQSSPDIQSISAYLVYELGYNQVYEIPVFTYEGYVDANITFATLEILQSNKCISDINLDLMIDSKELKHQKIVLNDEVITNQYLNQRDNTWQWISIEIALISTITFGVLIYRKLKMRKKSQMH